MLIKMNKQTLTWKKKKKNTGVKIVTTSPGFHYNSRDARAEHF